MVISEMKNEVCILAQSYRDRFNVEAFSSPKDLRNDCCLQVYDLWRDREPERPFEAFELLDISAAVPYVCLIDRIPGEADFRFTFVGQMIVNITQRDLTGTAVLEPDTRAVLTKGFCRYYLENSGPSLSHDAYSISQKDVVYRFNETIALPVTSRQGSDQRFLLVHGIDP